MQWNSRPCNVTSGGLIRWHVIASYFQDKMLFSSEGSGLNHHLYTPWLARISNNASDNLTVDPETIVTILIGITKLVRIYKFMLVVAERSSTEVPPFHFDAVVDSDGIQWTKSV